MPGRSPGHRRTDRRAGPAPHLSWKFESSRYRPDRVCSINGSGSVCQPTDTDDADRPADRTFHYRDNGALEYTIEFTPTGKELRKSVYAPDLSIVEFKGGSTGTVAGRRPSFCRPTRAV